MSLTSLKPHLKYEASHNPLLFTIKPLLDPASTTNPNTQIPACPVILLYPTHTHTRAHINTMVVTHAYSKHTNTGTHIYSIHLPIHSSNDSSFCLQKQKPAKCCQTLTANSSSVHQPDLQHVCTARVWPLCYSS